MYERIGPLPRPAAFPKGRRPFYSEAEYHEQVMKAPGPAPTWRTDTSPLRAYLNGLRGVRRLTFNRLMARYDLDFFSTDPYALKLCILVLEQDIGLA